MLACARAKSDALGAPATWIQSDILETPHQLDGTADLVYTGRGALCWMLDLEAWARVVARLLKPGGRVYIFEGHPLTWVWSETADRHVLHEQLGDYFMTDILSSDDWPETYVGPLDDPRRQSKHERQWTLGQIVTALANADLRVLALEEHPDTFWDHLPRIPSEVQRRLPNTFSLLATADPPPTPDSLTGP